MCSYYISFVISQKSVIRQLSQQTTKQQDGDNPYRKEYSNSKRARPDEAVAKEDKAHGDASKNKKKHDSKADLTIRI